MQSFSIKIEIFLKSGVLDAEGETTRKALLNLGFSEVEKVRFGKSLNLRVTSESADAARERVKSMCSKILVNEVIEDYEIIVNPS